MKKLSLSFFLGLVLILSLGIFSASADLGTDPIATGIACVNQDAVAGIFQIEFFDNAGTSVTTLANQAIAANGSALYFTTSIAGLPAGFEGSAVVSADVNLACSVNTQTTTGTLRVGTSNGVGSGLTGTTLYAPQILNDLSGFDSVIAVQNTTATAANVTITYFNSAGVEVFSHTLSVPGNSSHVFDQTGDEDGDTNPDLPAGFIGSATASSSADLAGTVIMSADGASTSTAQYLAYNAAPGGSLVVRAPRVVKNLSGVGYTSGFSCQNVGAAATDISADLSVLDQIGGTIETATLSQTGVGAGQSWAVYLGGTIGNATLDGISRYFGSAVLTSTSEEIVCIFNEDVRTPFPLAGQGSTYNGFEDGSQSTTVFFSQIVDLGGTSYQGGFQVANTSTTAGTCTYSYTDSGGANLTVTGNTIAANSSNSVFAPSVFTAQSFSEAGSFNGSAVVTCDVPVLGIYNLSGFSFTGDPFITNSGINQ